MRPIPTRHSHARNWQLPQTPRVGKAGVRKVNAANGKVTLKHCHIENLGMSAMTKGAHDAHWGSRLISNDLDFYLGADHIFRFQCRT
ncbi:copper-binding protein [Cupriavidus sp. IDO]|uniref:copper-binding protein n=1 Tax=Cupriavidus sp. IDO TaxID=1539142 RepID=UPI0009E199D0|nr:copper-binding protein [Cupriavidus sp. IDO]